MGKKKKPHAQTGIVRWPSPERVELLAWLDHSLKHDELDFEATVSAHLKQSHQMDCRSSHAYKKLYDLWYRYGENSSSREKVNWRTDVFTRGSSCFVHLANDEKSDIQLAVERLEVGYVDRRRMRSSLKILLPSNPPTPSRIKREVGSIEQSDSGGNDSSKKRRKDVDSHQASPPQSKDVSDSGSMEKEAMSPNDCSQLILSNSTLEVDDTGDDEGSSKALIPNPSMSCQPLLSPRDGDCGQMARNSQENTSDAVSDDDSVKQSHLIAEIRRLHEQLLIKDDKIYEVELERDELDKRVDDLESIQMQRDATEGALIGETIDRQNIIIKNLARQLDDRQALGTFTALRLDCGERFGDTRILDGFQDIFSESKCTPYEEISTNQLNISFLDEHTNLRLLVCNGLGLNPQVTHTQESYQVDLSSLSFQAIMRALTTSAFREWVFETDFPSFDEERSSMLASYRDHLAKQDGAKALRNLDLSVRRSQIRDRHFRIGLVMQKAAKLAEQLSLTLSPLFHQQLNDPHEASWDGFATWGQKRDEWRERRTHLVDMFAQALRLKADSTLNIEDYEMVMYPPGTIFDKNTMTAETKNGMTDLVNNHNGRRVQLCLDAAIFSYPRKPLGDLTPVSEATTTSTNFVRKDAVTRAGIRPILKAVVVLQED